MVLRSVRWRLQIKTWIFNSQKCFETLFLKTFLRIFYSLHFETLMIRKLRFKLVLPVLVILFSSTFTFAQKLNSYLQTDPSQRIQIAPESVFKSFREVTLRLNWISHFISSLPKTMKSWPGSNLWKTRWSKSDWTNYRLFTSDNFISREKCTRCLAFYPFFCAV